MAKEDKSLSERKNEFINKHDDTIRVISLFSGCGGMDLGFKGDFEFLGKKYEKNKFEIIYANEIDKYACETYKHNFKHSPIFDDIRNITNDEFPDAEIVLGGFPCQDYSHSGKRNGLSSERGRLYLEMKRVIKKVKPYIFIAENVDGIRTSKHNEVSALTIILDDFRKVGYNVEYRVLNAADFGVPQRRKRIIIVGVRNDLKIKPLFPEAILGDVNWVSAKQAIDDLWEKHDDETIFNHKINDFSKAKFYEGKRTQGNLRIKENEPAPTIRAEHHGNIEGHYRVLGNDEFNLENWRRLSVRECARLQSFPDNFVFPCSASRAYKQVGNAVPPVLAWHVAQKVFEMIGQIKIK